MFKGPLDSFQTNVPALPGLVVFGIRPGVGLVCKSLALGLARSISVLLALWDSPVQTH